MSEEFSEDFGFEEKKKFFPRKGKQEEEVIVRVHLPEKNQLIGIVEKLLGNKRMYVRCVDGKVRHCRVPGGRQRRVYPRPGDLVIVRPWEYEEDTKGDVIYKYTKTQVQWLRDKGYLKKLEEEF